MKSGVGWQTASFSTPVAITAGTTYVVSYHTNYGHYAATGPYFTSPVTNGPLTAPANAGVYTYNSASVFPSSTFNAANYWVDVLFSPTGGGTNQPPVAANDSGFNATQNTPLTIAASALLANDTDPNGDALTHHGSKRRRQRHRQLQRPEQHRHLHADDGLYGTGVLQLCHLRRPGRNRQCFRQSDRQPRLVLDREPVLKLGHAGGAIEFRYVTGQSRRTVHVVRGRHHHRHQILQEC